MDYNYKAIETKWQQQWRDGKIYAAKDFNKKEKKYILGFFPYPSGAGIHLGHALNYTVTDIVARFERMRGFNVLHPMGWDAFGLPAENFAIKSGIHPSITTADNIANFRKQLDALGLGFDWDREINSTDPAYYKWTQWIFLQLYKMGLAYEAEVSINWCPKDKTGLANEEVVDGKCDRCGTVVEKKLLRQWLLRITKYAERLIADLDGIDWPERIKEMQRNWIGKSTGANLDFASVGSEEKISVFTTRIDTLFSGTFVILAPEHQLIQKLKPQITNWDAVEKYIAESTAKKDFERTAENTEKTGVELQGVRVINPANGKDIAVWVSDFVLGSYGFGAVFGDAHDDRDFAFAKKYNIPLAVSVKPADEKDLDKIVALETCFPDDGILFNSDQFDGLTSKEAREKITEWLAAQGKAEPAVNYKLRDWVFSRQRYWGEPIPIVHCAQCGVVPVPEDQLPVLLPQVEKYEPTGTGESPLASIDEWVNTTCPQCSGPAKRETNTMPQWAGSSWYFLRFPDPKNTEAFADTKKIDYWMPVDTYVGGAEHAVLHLLYARFWIKALQDAGLLSFGEPFAALRNQGLILAADGRKMSKSLGNVVNPDDVIAEYGADTLRLYLMFMGPFEDAKPWNTESIRGMWRFLQRVWKLQELPRTSKPAQDAVLRLQNQTIAKVTKDVPGFKFNTAVSALMQFLNLLGQQKEISQDSLEVMVKLLAPFAPHITEEMWAAMGNTDSVHIATWPMFDPKYLEESTVEIAVQINGKVRGTMTVSAAITEDEALAEAKKIENVARYLAAGTVQKVIFVPRKLLSLVVR